MYTKLRLYGGAHKKISLTTVILCIFLHIIQPVYACTTAIIPAQFTQDNRPILYKNRDSQSLDNDLVYVPKTKNTYGFVGLADTPQKNLKHNSQSNTFCQAIWAGFNSTGFGIMNSSSYNFTSSERDMAIAQEGIIMRHALAQCASVQEFKTYLDTRKNTSPQDTKTRVASNFGVLDAYGNCAYFEVYNTDYTYYDAHKQILIRTNFSHSGKKNGGSGYIRYQTAQELLDYAQKKNIISPIFLLQKISRSLYHSLTQENLEHKIIDLENSHTTHQVFSCFEDFIPRYRSSSALVIQGIQPGENPELTMLWTMLGFPPYICHHPSLAFTKWSASRKYTSMCSQPKNLSPVFACTEI